MWSKKKALCSVCKKFLPEERFGWVVNRCYKVRASVCMICMSKLSAEEYSKVNNADIERAIKITGNSRLGRFDDVIANSKLARKMAKNT